MPNLEARDRDVSFWDAFPKGVILPWYGTGDDLPREFKGKWAFCDGNNGTPNLENRFLYGSGPIQDLDQTTGGQLTHSHSVEKGNRDGQGFESEGDECRIVVTSKESSLPPYCRVRYLIRT